MKPTHGLGNKGKLAHESMNAPMGHAQVERSSAALSKLLALDSAQQDPQPYPRKDVLCELFSDLSYSSNPWSGEGRTLTCLPMEEFVLATYSPQAQVPFYLHGSKTF